PHRLGGIRGDGAIVDAAGDRDGPVLGHAGITSWSGRGLAIPRAVVVVQLALEGRREILELLEIGDTVLVDPEVTGDVGRTLPAATRLRNRGRPLHRRTLGGDPLGGSRGLSRRLGGSRGLCRCLGGGGGGW